MYGKHFESMYSGSMVGAGAVVFAVMGYVIAKAVPDVTVGTQVELNPKLMALILGEDEEKVEMAIEFLCSPDAKSRTKKEDGRRLIRLGEYAYQVVNGAKYRALANEEKRRSDNRFYQQASRMKKKGRAVGIEAGYESAQRARDRGDEKGAPEIEREVDEAIEGMDPM